MSDNTTNLWGIHAGKTGDADALFLNKDLVALGWDEMGNLSALNPQRDAFKDRLSVTYPGTKPGAIPTNAGQLFRFVHEMKKGDFVAYPSKADRMIHLGKVASDYLYQPAKEESYRHRRKVKWLRAVSRTQFSQGALHEIGAAMSFFLIKNYADEFLAAIEGEAPSVQPANDPTVKQVAEEIEDTTRDFVLKTLSRETKGLPFEEFVKHLLECMGYQARLTRKNEPSVDIIAHKDLLGIEPPIIKVQVKSGDGVVADKDVSALFGKLSPNEYGLFITLGKFSNPSRNFEQSKSNLRLIDGEELIDLIFQHYEHFNSRYKGLLPLRRVYVPEPVEDGE